MNLTSAATEGSHLITHVISKQDINSTVTETKKRIIQEGDNTDATVDEQIKLVDDLAQFDFGRFLLINKGINGYWTRHIVLWPKNKLSNQVYDIHPLEKWLLEEAPTIKATQERFVIFQTLLQESLQEGRILASIPCGTMDDLLTLNFSKFRNIKMVGIDLDPHSIEEAKKTAETLHLADNTKILQSDAWGLNIKNEFDIITSNGLNIYEPDDKKVILLYKKFYDALKPGGILISSFLTPPPTLNPESSWKIKNLDKETLRLQKIIFSYILNAKWQAFRTEIKTIEQLKCAGFKEIQIYYDNNKLFPTFKATK